MVMMFLPTRIFLPRRLLGLRRMRQMMAPTMTTRICQTTSSLRLEIEDVGEVEREHQVLCRDEQQQFQQLQQRQQQ